MDLSKFESWLDKGTDRIKESSVGKLFESAMGSFFEKLKYTPGLDVNDRVKRNEFEVSLLILSAAVIKASGGNSPYETEYVRNFLLKNFDPKFIEARMYLLDEVLKKGFPIRPVCQQIKKMKSHAVRLQLVQYLFGIADADLDITPDEEDIIQHIARNLGISDKDFESIKTMFFTRGAKADVRIEEYYVILEIPPSATEEEIKAAYRRLVKKFHPDKVQHLGENIQKSALENFQKLQEAYQMIKKVRKFN